MIDLEEILKHQNARYIIIGLLNDNNNWLASTFVQLGCFKEKQAMQSAIAEYVKTVYSLQNSYGATEKSYSDFLMTDTQLPRAAIAYLLNTCLANNNSNFFQAVCALYIALEKKELEYEKYRAEKSLTETLYLFLLANLQYEEMAA